MEEIRFKEVKLVLRKKLDSESSREYWCTFRMGLFSAISRREGGNSLSTPTS